MLFYFPFWFLPPSGQHKQGGQSRKERDEDDQPEISEQKKPEEAEGPEQQAREMPVPTSSNQSFYTSEARQRLQRQHQEAEREYGMGRDEANVEQEEVTTAGDQVPDTEEAGPSDSSLP